MLSVEQVRKRAWDHLQSSKALLAAKKWDDAEHICGFALEMILKARMCVDHNWADFPETRSEIKSSNKARGIKQDIHDLESLLKVTSLETDVKRVCLNEWSICVEWTPDSRYRPVGTINQQSATELIRAADQVMRQITSHSGLEGYDPARLLTLGNPYLKLVVAEHDLSDAHGDFSLFALWRRPNSHPDSIDVVVSAPWIDASTRSGVEFVTKEILNKLPGDEINAISAVIPLEESHPIVQGLHKCFGLHHGDAHIVRSDFGDFRIEEAYIITSRIL